MAGFVLTDDEYNFIVSLEKDLLARAQNASPRASSHFQAAAKVHSAFLAKEEGKRSQANKRTAAKAERDALRLKRQQDRLTKLQADAQQRRGNQGGQSTERGSRAS